MDAEEIKALQDEEFEVLESIYEGDDAFSIQDKAKKNHFQYKFGEDGSGKSFVLDLRWGEQYPEVMPEISMETFYNRHLKPEVKEKIDLAVREEAEPLLGMSMTYTLFEFVKGELDSLLEDQPEVIQEIVEAVEKVKIEDDISCKPFRNMYVPPYESFVPFFFLAKPKVKKEQLTKAQKRRQWDKGGIDTEDRPRGWDWVDVIRHLAQTGGKAEE